jgi:ApaG protein
VHSKPLPNAEKPEELSGLRVIIDRVVYMPEAETPPDRPHAFAYFITIQNDSTETVTIKGRKWVIKNDASQTTAVEADGVVGEFPRLEPGEHFSYNSYHINNTGVCWAEGSYLGVTDDGRRVMTRIPHCCMARDNAEQR